MSTALVKPRKRGGDLSKLKAAERLFVLELLATQDWNVTAAVRKAYPKNKHPAQYGTTLMKRPRIKAILGKFMHEREERCKLEADQVIQVLRDALFLDPLEFFSPEYGNGKPTGRWTITDPKLLPPWVRRLVKGMKVRHVKKEDGTVEDMFELTLMDKDKALELALKHLGLLVPETIPTNTNIQLFLDQLAAPTPLDPIEARIEQEQKRLEQKR